MARGAAALAALMALPALAAAHEMDGPCTQANDFCTPFAICVEATGERFLGRSYGQDIGELHAMSSAGAVCSGGWFRREDGRGEAILHCDDGRRASAVYDWFEPESGTAVGEGAFSDGTLGRFWGGHNLQAYFEAFGPQERQRMACEPHEMTVPLA